MSSGDIGDTGDKTCSTVFVALLFHTMQLQVLSAC